MATSKFRPRLKDLRIQAGLSQVQAAERLGVHQGHICRIEKEDANMMLSTLRAYVEGLGYHLELVIVTPHGQRHKLDKS